MPKLHHSRHTLYCALLLQISGTCRICLNARSSNIHMQSWFMCWTPLICWYVKFWLTVVVHIAMMSLKLDFSPSLITLELRCGWNLFEENAYIKNSKLEACKGRYLMCFLFVSSIFWREVNLSDLKLTMKVLLTWALFSSTRTSKIFGLKSKDEGHLSFYLLCEVS
jgi:hypothetical protein